jgi:hypothetical protein
MFKHTLTLVCLLALVCAASTLTGCKKSAIDQALDSDANGYVCLDCEAKFYTDREVFASHCPKCKKVNVEQVLGFVCETDKTVMVAARSRGARACSKCGKPASGVTIPKEADLKAWGAVKYAASDVGG